MPDTVTDVYIPILTDLRRRAGNRGFARYCFSDGLWVHLHYLDRHWTVVAYRQRGTPTMDDLHHIRAALRCPNACWHISGPVAVLMCDA